MQARSFLLVTGLVLAVLSGLGMPLRAPCCPPMEAVTAVEDPEGASGCCPFPDCCRGEKRGAAPATISAKVSVDLSPAVVSLRANVSVPANLPAPCEAPAVASRAHSPPLSTSTRQAILSTFRV